MDRKIMRRRGIVRIVIGCDPNAEAGWDES